MISNPFGLSEQDIDAEGCISIRENHILLTDLKDVHFSLVADNRKRIRSFTFDQIFTPSKEQHEAGGNELAGGCNEDQEKVWSLFDGSSS